MSILATWLAIWFSAEFGYSSPLCVRKLATLPFVKQKTNKQTKNTTQRKNKHPGSYRFDILSYLTGNIWHLALS